MLNTVFLSSTYVDLQPERESIMKAILRLQQRYFGMEFFGSDPEKSIDLSLSMLKKSTIYICIIAHRYGSIDKKTGKSITQIEYETAKNMNIPILAYFKDSKCLVEPTSKFIDFDSTSRQKLEGFRQTLISNSVVQYFNSTDDLAAKVTADVAKILISIKSQITHNNYSNEIDFNEMKGSCYQNWRVDNNSKNLFLIPMFGARYVGKTVYGSMLIHNHSSGFSKNKIRVELVDKGSILYQYYPYLLKGEWAPATQPGYMGTHHKAEIIIKRNKFFRSSNISLRFLDISGEEWNDCFDPEFKSKSHNVVTKFKNNRFTVINSLMYCKALSIFIEPKPPYNGHPNFVLDIEAEKLDYYYANIIAQIGYYKGKFTKPTAIIITKCDLVNGLFDSTDLLHEYISCKYPLTYNQIINNFKLYKFFAVSSVGHVNEKGKPINIDPVGIWEPIFWIVSKL